MSFLSRLFRRPKLQEEFTPEEVEKVLEGSRKVEQGFTYTPIGNKETGDIWLYACPECGAVEAPYSSKPFPHEEDCSIRLYTRARAKGLI